MNIAILIGIAKYKSETPLPACGLDAENMRRLLAATKKYDDIQLVVDNTNASQVKDALRQFFAKYQTVGGIEEAFVYFSGHGVYQNDAMLCCSDYDSNRPATTSMSNAELDDLLRSVKPAVAVKVIDACQSGSPYIKDASAGFEKALSKSSLGSFICMASSRQDQSSYASASESFFTKRWIDAALSKEDGSILYRDIQAALADAFVSDPDQTPFFVSQGSGLEVFSTVTEDMKALTAARAKSLVPDKPEAAIVQLIKAQVEDRDKAFVAHKLVLNAVEASKESLVAAGITEPMVQNFYVKSVKTDFKLPSIPKARSVAAFAEEQSWAKRYFVKVNKESYQTKVRKDTLGGLLSIGASKHLFTGGGSDDDFVIETRQRPSTLEATETLPLEVAELSFTSNHPSLPGFLIYIGLVHSLTEVMVLSATVRLTQRGWDSRTPELSDVQWRYQAQTWADVVKDPGLVWRDAQARGEADIRTYLESLLPKSETSVEAASVAGAVGDTKPAA
jgi:hypothetical protein